MNTIDYGLVIILFLGSYLLIKRLNISITDTNILLISFAIPLVYLYIKNSVFVEGFSDINNADPNYVIPSVKNELNNIIEEPLEYEKYPGKPDYTTPDVDDAREIATINKNVLKEINMREQKEKEKIRGEYEYEMPYTVTHEYNTRPLGRAVSGYTYLPPENWFRPWDRTPICISGKNYKAEPSVASAPLNQQYLEFDTHVEVERPMEIDTKYLDEIQNHRAGNKRRVK